MRVTDRRTVYCLAHTALGCKICHSNCD